MVTAHEEACPQRSVDCMYCSLKVQAVSLDNHIVNKCLMAPTSCEVIPQPGNNPFHLANRVTLSL